ncbi:unnamed protein product [Pedinophyceae sp. YPF-701]|nr:unnamed protein product [Pedinophyceae sp. YPF-701]
MSGVHCLYIFDRAGTCLYYREWDRPCRPTGSQEDEQKMIFGLCFTLKTLAAAIDPTEGRKPLGSALKIGEGSAFRSFATNNYRTHFQEHPSGIKLILLTRTDWIDCQPLLRHIYEHAYVPYVVRNPLCQPGVPFQSEGFESELETVIGAETK